MKIKSFALATGVAISGIIASGSATPASAVTFDLGSFGEDIAANGGANPIPNSQAAEALFLSKLSGATTQNFDSVRLPAPASVPEIRALTPGTALTTADFPGTNIITTTSTEIPQDPNGSTVTFSTSGVRFNDTATTPTSNGRFAISGTQYYEVGNGTFTITFSTPMAALGFYATDVEDPDGLILQFDNDATKVLTIPRTVGAGSTDKSALYYGFVAANPSEIFTSVTFGRAVNVSNDKFGLDNVTFATRAQVNSFATAVPEPLTIIGTLLGGSVAFRLRKKLDRNNV
jgi:hypothetical protein